MALVLGGHPNLLVLVDELSATRLVHSLAKVFLPRTATKVTTTRRRISTRDLEAGTRSMVSRTSSASVSTSRLLFEARHGVSGLNKKGASG